MVLILVWILTRGAVEQSYPCEPSQSLTRRSNSSHTPVATPTPVFVPALYVGWSWTPSLGLRRFRGKAASRPGV